MAKARKSRRPFISKAARAAGVTTEQGYLNYLAQQRGARSYSELRRTTDQRWQPWASLEKLYRNTLNRPPPKGYQRVTQSGWQRHVRAVRKEVRTKGVDLERPGGALARLLEYLGIRAPGSQDRVGETPAASGAAA